jgi:hypothetical protein
MQKAWDLFLRGTDIWEILHKVFVPKQMIMRNSSYGHPWTISKIILKIFIQFSSLITFFSPNEYLLSY